VNRAFFRFKLYDGSMQTSERHCESQQAIDFIGERDGIRTRDPLIKSKLLTAETNRPRPSPAIPSQSKNTLICMAFVAIVAYYVVHQSCNPSRDVSAKLKPQ
jgi:hypothetical protein